MTVNQGRGGGLLTDTFFIENVHSTLPNIEREETLIPRRKDSQVLLRALHHARRKQSHTLPLSHNSQSHMSHLGTTIMHVSPKVAESLKAHVLPLHIRKNRHNWKLDPAPGCTQVQSKRCRERGQAENSHSWVPLTILGSSRTTRSRCKKTRSVDDPMPCRTKSQTSRFSLTSTNTEHRERAVASTGGNGLTSNSDPARAFMSGISSLRIPVRAKNLS